MKTLVNHVSRTFHDRDAGLLLLRIGLGLIFLMHGWAKITALSQFVHMLGALGILPWAVYFISWLEFLGGIALLLGVATRPFAFLLGFEMLVATIMVDFGRGLGMEFLLAVACFALVLMGSGRYSIYPVECKRCGGLLCNGATGVCVAVE